jgi:hypothetical protein
LGVGWKLHFYTGGTTTPITTYNARTGGSANANPDVADANGRFGKIWITDSQTIKWVLADENDVTKVTVDNYLIERSVASFDTDLQPSLPMRARTRSRSPWAARGRLRQRTCWSALAVLPTRWRHDDRQHHSFGQGLSRLFQR